MLAALRSGLLSSVFLALCMGIKRSRAFVQNQCKVRGTRFVEVRLCNPCCSTAFTGLLVFSSSISDFQLSVWRPVFHFCIVGSRCRADCTVRLDVCFTCTVSTYFCSFHSVDDSMSTIPVLWMRHVRRRLRAR